MMKRILSILFCFCSLALFANTAELSASDYISTWKDEAIYQMAAHKIPASITLAQGMLESGNGNSRLALDGNNHFGIKCHDWDGKKIYEDDETKGECFRKYKDAHESFEDHSIFLQKNRYQSLFKLNTDDYRGWAKGLKDCGYATNPKYPDLLIDLVKRYNLDAYDKIGLDFIKAGKIPDRPNHTNGKSKEKNEDENEKPKHDITDFNEVLIAANREVKLSDNKIKFIIANAGDTPKSVADDLEMMSWQITKYNDLSESRSIEKGQIIYLQPKRGTAKIDSYEVPQNDTWWGISQHFGIKLKKLYKLNSASASEEPITGSTVKLR